MRAVTRACTRGNLVHDQSVRQIMGRRLAALGSILLVAGCTGGGHHAAMANAPTTTKIGSRRFARAEVTDIKVGSLPESPVLNWSAERAHWAQVLAMLPEQLPRPVPNPTCTTGPFLIVRLRGGSELDYQCTLPPAILATRNYIISFSHK
jgi:hypothetical protein